MAMEVAVSSISGVAVYGLIPAATLRHYVDGVFPSFAKCARADIAPFGAFHRFREGHDLLIDVPATIRECGFRDGFHHAGHIILTDFPTKVGIPIPGLSETGLGHLLVDHGISKGWLSLHLMDGAVGVLAISEGSSDLIAALAGHLDMTAATFFDTFFEGGLEICLSAVTKNPFLALGGIENLAAGLASAWHTFTIAVDPLTFLGGAMCSAVLGALLGFALSGADGVNLKARASLARAARGAAVGGLFTIKTAFGFGCLLGLAASSLGKALAAHQERDRQILLSVDQDQFDRLLSALSEGDPAFGRYWDDCLPRLWFMDSPHLLPTELKNRLSSDITMFSQELRQLPSDLRTSLLDFLTPATLTR
jgi:hypothetical protein